MVSFYKLFRNIRQQSSNGASAAAARSSAQITLLRLHLNIADLLTMFVYTTSQIIWMLTFQVCLLNLIYYFKVLAIMFQSPALRLFIYQFNKTHFSGTAEIFYAESASSFTHSDSI